MKKLLALTIAGALILCVASCAFGDLRPPYFYDVTVTLTDGTSITGGSYGLMSYFDSRLSSTTPVKSVVLSYTPGSIQGHITFYDNPETKTYERSGDRISSHDLSVYTEYEIIEKQPGSRKFYWIKEKVEVPLINIIRVDTLKIIGKGFAIYEDPAVYANIKEPYLMVEDCGLGCPAKLFSEDPSITKEKLQKLWDKYLDCKIRSTLTLKGYKRMDKIMAKYKLKILVDPFCID